jgi:hypothetical protein
MVLSMSLRLICDAIEMNQKEEKEAKRNILGEDYGQAEMAL